MKITNATCLTNSELVTEVTRLAHGEREATVALIVHLAEFDARHLYEAAGFSSTFKYCMEILHLSEDATFNRIEAARAARRFPVVLDMLITGALRPTTARMLARHLTPDNHRELLASASGKSKQEVERLLAGLFPQPDVRSSIRVLRARPVVAPVTPPAGGAPAGGSGEKTERHIASAGLEVQAALAVAPQTARPVGRPLAADRYEIRFTASAETWEKLRMAQDLLGHAVPTGDLSQVFERALTLLVEDLQRKKFAATPRPRMSQGQSEDTRHIPAGVRRGVWTRDRGRCAFVASSGRPCGARRFLEFHHDVPYGVGGRATVANIELRCKSHNRYEAERFYGPGRRHGGGGVVNEPITVYGCLAPTLPVPERVTATAPPLHPMRGTEPSPRDR